MEILDWEHSWADFRVLGDSVDSVERHHTSGHAVPHQSTLWGGAGGGGGGGGRREALRGVYMYHTERCVPHIVHMCTTLRGVYHTAFCILQICTKCSKGTDCTTSACTSVPVPVLFANLHSACLSAPSGQRGLYHAVWIKRMYLYQAVPKKLCWAA